MRIKNKITKIELLMSPLSLSTTKLIHCKIITKVTQNSRVSPFCHLIVTCVTLHILNKIVSLSTE